MQDTDKPVNLSPRPEEHAGLHSGPIKDRNALLASVRETFEAGLAIVEKKNRDYGAVSDPFANFRGAGFLGISVEKGILLRTLDKIKRIDNLLSHDAYVTEEALEDSIVDAINYLAILKAFREMHALTLTT